MTGEIIVVVRLSGPLAKNRQLARSIAVLADVVDEKSDTWAIGVGAPPEWEDIDDIEVNIEEWET